LQIGWSAVNLDGRCDGSSSPSAAAYLLMNARVGF